MQTSIEWFIEHLLGNGLLRLTKEDHSLYSELRDKAKEMYKQEIKDAKDGLYETVNDTVNEVDADFPIEHKLASVWVFDTNASKWSNNDDTAGDNHASFIAGYRKAQETLYTEEQVREAMSMARKLSGVAYTNDEIIQSLKQPKKD
jgi:hypothetical protein